MYAIVPATLPVCRLYWNTRGLASYVSWVIGTPVSAEAESGVAHANPMLTFCLIRGSVQPAVFTRRSGLKGNTEAALSA